MQVSSMGEGWCHGRFAGGRGGRLCRQMQLGTQARGAVGMCLQLQAPSGAVGNALHDGQSQPAASGVGCLAPKALQGLAAFLGVQAGAVVLDAHHQ